MSLYRNKYRIESARLKNWDYSSEGYYFITICIHNREQILGNIISNEMVLSDIGKIVEKEWLKSFEIRRELFCDTYCIMPNHIHGIVVINNDDGPVETHGRGVFVQTHGRASLQTDKLQRMPKSISSFVAGFKSSATKLTNEHRGTQGNHLWQPRFHDHIIRDEKELERIREYILNNRLKWIKDCFFK